MNYGINNNSGKPSKEQVFEILDFVAKEGIKILDSADAYGNALSVIAEYITNNSESFEVNSKFNWKKGSIEGQLQETLRSLGVNSINTYYYHNYNDLEQFPDALFELIYLKKKKLIKKIGVSVYTNCEFKKVVDIPEIDVIQFPFNLLDNRCQRGHLIEEAKMKNKELHARSVFLQGLFFKDIRKLPDKLILLVPYLKEIHSLSDKYGIDMVALSLLYAINQPDIDYVIIGVDNLEQIRKNLKFSSQSLKESVLEKIDDIVVKETELLYPKNWN